MKKIIKAFFIFHFSFFIINAAHAATLINDTEIENVLTELITPLADAANIPHGRLKVYIVNDDEFNAFVRGGEDVFVYTGLLTRIKSPDALQAVIAHEMGHMLGGHMVQMSARMESETMRALLIQALGIGLMVAGGNPSLGAGVLAGSSGIAQQSMLSFSRDEERIADNMGVDLMVRAGLDPRGFIEVFEQMNEQMGAAESRINPNRINHPLTSERLKNIKEKIKEAQTKFPSCGGVPAGRGGLKCMQYGKDHPVAQNGADTPPQEGNLDHAYAMVRAKLVGYLDTAARVRDLYPTADKSDSAIYARAIANMQAGNLGAAKTGTLTLISRRPSDPYFYELLGDIEYQFGHYDDSVTAYEKSLKLIPGTAPQIQTALALVLTERNKPGDRDNAIELCKRALLADPAPLTYWVMARAYDADPRGDWAMAEYYNMSGNKQKTREYAKRAQQNLKKNTPEYLKSGDLLR